MTVAELVAEIHARLDEALIVEEPPRHEGLFAVFVDPPDRVMVGQANGPRFAITVQEISG